MSDADGIRPVRLDHALAERGLARSRSHAATLIKNGLVTVDDVGVVKPSTLVPAEAHLNVAQQDHYVSRGAHKLIAALDAWPILVAGRDALDVGASTGGFTQVLLERGARSVIALDVGHGQLDPALRGDARVTPIEGFNARELSVERLPSLASGVTPTLAVADLSFISLRHVLEPLAQTLAGVRARRERDEPGDGMGVAAAAALATVGDDIVVLVKPQFEVGRTGVREGIVTDPGLRADAVQSVLWAAWDAGLGTHGVLGSPIVGTHGNSEMLAWLRPRTEPSTLGRVEAAPHHDARVSVTEGNPSEWMATVNAWAGV